MSTKRSGASVVQSLLDIKRWQQQTPSVAEVRPARCPFCDAASCPVGGAIQLHGHGLRERQVRGPLLPTGDPVMITIPARRFRCVPCRGVIIVVPREIVGRRMYSASAIGFALALYGLVLASAREVRRRVSPLAIFGVAAAVHWATLTRWVRAVRQRELFPSVPLPDPRSTLRCLAAIAASALAASADSTTRALRIEERAFFGAAHAA